MQTGIDTTEVPKAEVPKAEVPKAEAPKAEAPKVAELATATPQLSQPLVYPDAQESAVDGRLAPPLNDRTVILSQRAVTENLTRATLGEGSRLPSQKRFPDVPADVLSKVRSCFKTMSDRTIEDYLQQRDIYKREGYDLLVTWLDARMFFLGILGRPEQVTKTLLAIDEPIRADTAYCLATALKTGQNGLPCSPEKSMQYLRLAAEMGHDGAIKELVTACIYQPSNGATLTEGLHWLRVWRLLIEQNRLLPPMDDTLLSDFLCSPRSIDVKTLETSARTREDYLLLCAMYLDEEFGQPNPKAASRCLEMYMLAVVSHPPASAVHSKPDKNRQKGKHESKQGVNRFTNPTLHHWAFCIHSQSPKALDNLKLNKKEQASLRLDALPKDYSESVTLQAWQVLSGTPMGALGYFQWLARTPKRINTPELKYLFWVLRYKVCRSLTGRFYENEKMENLACQCLSEAAIAGYPLARAVWLGERIDVMYVNKLSRLLGHPLSGDDEGDIEKATTGKSTAEQEGEPSAEQRDLTAGEVNNTDDILFNAGVALLELLSMVSTDADLLVYRAVNNGTINTDDTINRAKSYIDQAWAINAARTVLRTQALRFENGPYAGMHLIQRLFREEIKINDAQINYLMADPSFVHVFTYDTYQYALEPRLQYSEFKLRCQPEDVRGQLAYLEALIWEGHKEEAKKYYETHKELQKPPGNFYRERLGHIKDTRLFNEFYTSGFICSHSVSPSYFYSRLKVISLATEQVYQSTYAVAIFEVCKFIGRVVKFYPEKFCDEDALTVIMNYSKLLMLTLDLSIRALEQTKFKMKRTLEKLQSGDQELGFQTERDKPMDEIKAEQLLLPSSDSPWSNPVFLQDILEADNVEFRVLFLTTTFENYVFHERGSILPPTKLLQLITKACEFLEQSSKSESRHYELWSKKINFLYAVADSQSQREIFVQLLGMKAFSETLARRGTVSSEDICSAQGKARSYFCRLPIASRLDRISSSNKYNYDRQYLELAQYATNLQGRCKHALTQVDNNDFLGYALRILDLWGAPNYLPKTTEVFFIARKKNTSHPVYRVCVQVLQQRFTTELKDSFHHSNLSEHPAILGYGIALTAMDVLPPGYALEREYCIAHLESPAAAGWKDRYYMLALLKGLEPLLPEATMDQAHEKNLLMNLGAEQGSLYCLRYNARRKMDMGLYHEATQQYLKMTAARCGSRPAADGLFELAELYRNKDLPVDGRTDSKRNTEIFQLWRKAARLHHPMALVRLYVLCINRMAQAKDKDEAPASPALDGCTEAQFEGEKSWLEERRYDPCFYTDLGLALCKDWFEALVNYPDDSPDSASKAVPANLEEAFANTDAKQKVLLAHIDKRLWPEPLYQNLLGGIVQYWNTLQWRPVSITIGGMDLRNLPCYEEIRDQLLPPSQVNGQSLAADQEFPKRPETDKTAKAEVVEDAVIDAVKNLAIEEVAIQDESVKDDASDMSTQGTEEALLDKINSIEPAEETLLPLLEGLRAIQKQRYPQGLKKGRLTHLASRLYRKKEPELALRLLRTSVRPEAWSNTVIKVLTNERNSSNTGWIEELAKEFSYLPELTGKEPYLLNAFYTIVDSEIEEDYKWMAHWAHSRGLQPQLMKVLPPAGDLMRKPQRVVRILMLILNGNPKGLTASRKVEILLAMVTTPNLIFPDGLVHLLLDGSEEILAQFYKQADDFLSKQAEGCSSEQAEDCSG